MNRNYSLYTPNHSSPNTLVFAAGMACNRFGHPYATEPTGIFADIATMVSNQYNMLFVDVHDMCDESTPFSHRGTTVEFQSQQIARAISEALNEEKISGKHYFIGQSLGSLAILHYLRDESRGAVNTGILMLAPPTSEGMECRHAFIYRA